MDPFTCSLNGFDSTAVKSVRCRCIPGMYRRCRRKAHQLFHVGRWWWCKGCWVQSFFIRYEWFVCVECGQWQGWWWQSHRQFLLFVGVKPVAASNVGIYTAFPTFQKGSGRCSYAARTLLQRYSCQPVLIAGRQLVGDTIESV